MMVVDAIAIGVVDSWLLDLYGGSLGSYLAIPLENEFLKISQTWVGEF